MLARGTISPNTYKQDKLEYVGEIDSVPVCVASKPIWDLAEDYLGLNRGTLDIVDALVVAGIATGRALAFNNSVKIIDCPRGQGRTAQYKYRWGVEVFNFKGIVPVLNNGKTLSDISSTTLTIEAPASVSPVKLTAPTLANVSGSKKFTWEEITGAGAYDVYNGQTKVGTVKAGSTLEYVYGENKGSYTVVSVATSVRYSSSDASTALVIS